MAISFNQTPNNIRVPFVAIEFDNSHANQSAVAQVYKTLIVGQRLADGTQPELEPMRVTSSEQARDVFGTGSMLASMIHTFQANDPLTECWAIALDDNSAGTKATGSVKISGYSASGTLSLYIGGERIQIGVAVGADATAIAADIASAIAANTELPTTATATDSTVVLTARHAGESGNVIDIRHSHYADESLPVGLALDIVPMSGGTGNPDASAVWNVLGDEQYNIIAFPYTDSANLTALETELDSRTGPLRMIDGHAITAAVGSHGELGSLGDSRNSEHLTIVAAHGSPTPVWSWAAAVAGVVAKHAQIDPARPFQTLSAVGLLAPHISDRFTLAERNLLLYDGISTTTVDAGGTVCIERLITSYSKNAAGADDPSYLDLNTLLTLSYLRWDFRTYIQQKYPRHKLANDGTRFGAGQAVITPKVGAAEALTRFRVWEDRGLVENADAFKEGLIVERNPQDPNRLDWLLPADLVNQFRVGAVQVQFHV